MSDFERFARANFPRFRPSQPTTMVRDVQPVPGSIWSSAAGLPPRPMRGAVVHVGAHIGEELEDYLAAGFGPIVLVEANPWIFARLLVHVDFWRRWLAVFAKVYDLADPPVIHAVNVAASDCSGLAPFVVTEYPMHSSLLMPMTPSVRPVAITSVVARPLDGVLGDLGVPASDVELLVLDTQGSEHKVLAGAAGALAHVKAVVVEMPEAPRYVGQATAAGIESILSRNGLTRRRGGPAGSGPANGVFLRATS